MKHKVRLLWWNIRRLNSQLDRVMRGLVEVVEGNDLETGFADHPGETFSAAIPKLDIERTYSFASASLVPLSRTIRGTLRDSSFAALMTPSAM